MAKLTLFRGVNPLYALFLIGQLGMADAAERMQAWESVLELPRPVARFCRVPKQDQLPPGPLATRPARRPIAATSAWRRWTSWSRGRERKTRGRGATYDEDRVWVLPWPTSCGGCSTSNCPGVRDLRTQAVWAAGELLEYGGNFNKYIGGKDLQKQEGILFRHLLRLILLLGEFKQLARRKWTPPFGRASLEDIAARLTESCRAVDPASTDRTLEQASGEAAEEAETAETPEENRGLPRDLRRGRNSRACQASSGR